MSDAMMAWAGRRLPFLASSRGVLLGLLGDLVHGPEADLIRNAQAEASACRLIFAAFSISAGLTPFDQQVIALRNERPEDPACVEARAVVDDDGRPS